jgi:hypothetical protein
MIVISAAARVGRRPSHFKSSSYKGQVAKHIIADHSIVEANGLSTNAQLIAIAAIIVRPAICSIFCRFFTISVKPEYLSFFVALL